MADSTVVLRLVTTYDGTQLSAGLDNSASAVKSSADKMAHGMEDAGEKTKFSMREARGSIALLGEEVGVRVPRHLQTFIAGLPGVGVALTSAFSVIAVVALIELIAKAVEKLETLKNAARDAARDWHTLTDATEEHADSLRVENERLQQTINHLAQVPENNLAIALAEAAVKADNLAKSLAKDLEEEDKLFAKQGVGIWSRIMGSVGTGDVEDKLKTDFEHVQDVIREGKDKIREASQTGDVKKVETAESSAATNTQKAYGEVIAYVKTQLDTATEAQNKYETSLSDNAEALAEGVAPYGDNTKRIELLKRALNQLQDQYDVASLSAKNFTLSTEAAGGKDQLAVFEKSDKAARIAAEQNKLAAEASHQAWEIAYKEAVSDLQEGEKLKIAATDAGSKERLAAIDEAFKEEDAKGLQDTSFYKSLVLQKLEAQRTFARDAAALQLKTIDDVAKAQSKAAAIEFAEQQRQLEETQKERSVKIDLQTKQTVKEGGDKGSGGIQALQAAQTQAQQLTELNRETSVAKEQAAVELLGVQLAMLKQQRDAEDSVYKQGLISYKTYSNALEELDKQVVAVKQEDDKRETEIHAASKKEQARIDNDYAKQAMVTQDQIANTFASETDKMILHSRNFHQAFNTLWRDMAQMALEHMVRMTAQFVAHQLVQTAAHAASEGAQTAATAAGTSARSGIGAAEDIRSIGKAAATSAAHAFKQVMKVVPFPANVVLAPAAAAAAFTAVIAFGSMAEKGFDVPGGGGVYPTILHPREMVLPADLAGGVRNMVKGGNTSTSTSGGSQVSIGQMVFAPTVNGQFNVEEHGEEFMQFAIGKLRRLGVTL